MEQSPKTSFIPKQTAGYPQGRQRRSFNILTFFAIVAFLSTLLFSGGVFFYQKHSEKELMTKKDELAKLKGSFSPNDIQEIRALERRLLAASTLLDQHLSLSQVFSALEDDTQKQAQLTDFEFRRLTSGAAEVALGGSAASFNTAALQKRVFAGEKSFEKGSVIFSDLGISEGTEKEDDKRIITFKVAARLDTKEVAYSIEPEASTSTSATSTANATTTPQAVIAASSTAPVPPSATSSRP